MFTQPPYHDLPAAYQLHYHFLFQTRRNRPVFEGSVRDEAERLIRDVCEREDYHLLGTYVQPQRLEFLLSLKPTQVVSRVVEKVKSNVSRHLFAQHPEIETLIGRRSLWGGSYRVESVGTISVAAAKAYVDSQREHHDVALQAPRRLSRYNAPDKASYCDFRHQGHVVHLLNFHLVVSVNKGFRAIDEAIAQYLTSLWLKVCEAKGYKLLSLDVLDDHAHCLLALAPKQAPQDVAEALMNNTSFLTLRRFSELQDRFPNGQLWTPGFFVRTVGNRTTAQVKSYFRGDFGKPPV